MLPGQGFFYLASTNSALSGAGRDRIDRRYLAVGRAGQFIIPTATGATVYQRWRSGCDVFLQWQWPLHSGRVFGWTGRILVFISGLLCMLLYVTGVIRWLQKRKAKKSRREKLARLAGE